MRVVCNVLDAMKLLQTSFCNLPILWKVSFFVLSGTLLSVFSVYFLQTIVTSFERYKRPSFYYNVGKHPFISAQFTAGKGGGSYVIG
jgi:hypothetical protein